MSDMDKMGEAVAAVEPEPAAEQTHAVEADDGAGGLCTELGDMAASAVWLRELMEPPDLRPGQANEMDEIFPGTGTCFTQHRSIKKVKINNM